MKVLMLKDVRKVGVKHSIVDVTDGYAINYLLPNKLAEIATPDKLEKALAQHAAHAKEKEQESAKLVECLRALNGVSVEIQARVTSKGSLFKSITAREIVGAIKTQKGIVIPESVTDLEQPIKSSGDHSVKLSAGNTHSSITVSVIASTSK